jgi:hypothetical protein
MIVAAHPEDQFPPMSYPQLSQPLSALISGKDEKKNEVKPRMHANGRE